MYSCCHSIGVQCKPYLAYIYANLNHKMYFVFVYVKDAELILLLICKPEARCMDIV